MHMVWTLQPEHEGAIVTMRSENGPSGIRPEDHEVGMSSSLENLANFVENKGR
ncbi:MAG: hypothetical protein GC138_04435 [Gammaproteobacteria bacterium]|nr:hypothetical protein [Gammaproteobacteria bacterium]